MDQDCGLNDKTTSAPHVGLATIRGANITKGLRPGSQQVAVVFAEIALQSRADGPSIVAVVIAP
jgi:hypothetical protein